MHAARCTLDVARCTLYAARCVLRAAHSWGRLTVAKIRTVTERAQCARCHQNGVCRSIREHDRRNLLWDRFLLSLCVDCIKVTFNFPEVT